MSDVTLIVTLRDWSRRVTDALSGDGSDYGSWLNTTLIEAHADLTRILDRQMDGERHRLVNEALEAERVVVNASVALAAANRAMDKAAETHQSQRVIARLGEIADLRQGNLDAAEQRRDAAQAAVAAFDEEVSE